jgi:Tol biopolymer transport system component
MYAQPSTDKPDQPSDQTPPPIKLNVTETLVDFGKEQPIGVDLYASPDLNHLAWLVFSKNKEGTKQAMVLDGVVGPEFDEIDKRTVVFSPDSKRLAYIAKKKKKSIVVVDGAAGKEYDNIVGFPLILFSPDSKRFAYIAEQGKNRLVVVDGEEGEKYTMTGMCVAFSPNSKRYAYYAAVEDEWFTVIDGVEGKRYDGVQPEKERPGICPAGVTSPIFSPDSKRVAAILYWGNHLHVIVDDYDGRGYMRSFVFSPDSQHFAYVAGSGEKMVVVVDGKPGAKCDYIGEEGIFFSPDSQRVAYILRKIVSSSSTTAHLVVDGVEGNPYQSVGPPVFSPDAKRIAYWAYKDNKFLCIVDGVDGNGYEPSKTIRDQKACISNPVFSPDSKRVAYWVRRGDNCLCVIDGKEGKEYNRVSLPIFSPDSRRVVYTVVGRTKAFVVVDGVEGPLFDYVGKPVFTSDSQHLVYGGTNEEHVSFIFVDGASVKTSGTYVPNSSHIYDSPTKFHYLITRRVDKSIQVYRVDIEITK